MTVNEFNIKYFNYLEEGHYGLDIDDSHIISYLDKVFQDLIIKVPEFKFSQIKLKFDNCRFYNNLYKVAPHLDITSKVEDYIEFYLNTKNIVKK